MVQDKQSAKPFPGRLGHSSLEDASLLSIYKGIHLVLVLPIGMKSVLIE